MLKNLFKGIFDSDTTSVISVTDFIICVACSLVIGLIISLCYMYKTRYKKNFVVILSLIPSIVCVIIMMVNGNIGTGVAVAGAFSLVRFRSLPGTAKEIGMLFLAMGTGLILGMGYIAFAFLFTIIIMIMYLVYNVCGYGSRKKGFEFRLLKITIPEDLDYTDVFDDIFKEYTKSCELIQVKTTNMGSMYKLTYEVVITDKTKEKEFIDKLRCRNGNLEINIARQPEDESHLL